MWKQSDLIVSYMAKNGYDSLEDMLDDNPGMVETIDLWIENECPELVDLGDDEFEDDEDDEDVEY